VGSGESLEEGFETIELADKGVAFKVIDDPASIPPRARASW
jgi:hypothetical protein